MTDLRYFELPQVAVRHGEVAFAETLATQAALELGIPTPAIRWFRIGSPPDGWAWATWTDDRRLAGATFHDRADEIWIASGMRRRQLAETVAHEVHHAAWVAYTGPGWRSQRETQAMEDQADAFAAAFLRDGGWIR